MNAKQNEYILFIPLWNILTRGICTESVCKRCVRTPEMGFEMKIAMKRVSY